MATLQASSTFRGAALAASAPSRCAGGSPIAGPLVVRCQRTDQEASTAQKTQLLSRRRQIAAAAVAALLFTTSPSDAARAADVDVPFFGFKKSAPKSSSSAAAEPALPSVPAETQALAVGAAGLLGAAVAGAVVSSITKTK